MKRRSPRYQVFAEIDLQDCPIGPVLEPLRPRTSTEKQTFAGWDTPLSPWGGFGLDSGLAVVEDDAQKVLEFHDQFRGSARERMIVAGSPELRGGWFVAEVKPLQAEYHPHHDRHECSEAYTGLIFRMETTRRHYLFCLEGRRRAVFYRRLDDEWAVLAEQAVELPDTYMRLEVMLDGDGIRCTCPALNIDFFCTDTTLKSGKAGIRTLGRARVARVQLYQTASQQARDRSRRVRTQIETRARGMDVPEAELKHTFDLAELGGTPQFADLAAPERYDMLVPGPESLRALTVDGQTLWETPLRVHPQIVFSAQHTEHGRLIYAFTGVREVNERSGIRGDRMVQTVADELIVLRGSDGEVVSRAKAPPLAPNMRYLDYATSSGNFTGQGLDIVLREWRQDLGGGGVHLWAYDRRLNPLWEHVLPSAWYGHHWSVQFCDVDGNGRDELLAGGTLFDAAGNVIWQHDRDAEMMRIHGGQHYDAVAVGRFADDKSLDPVAFLLGGSAGVYVVDALTGRTRAVHRIGHAQGRHVGKLRADLPGQQVLAITRWGSYGILTLFSGRGDRLWTIQPDQIGQGSCPVWWGERDTQLIWTNTTGPVQALYDGYGRKVKDLAALRKLWGRRMRRDVQTSVLRFGADPTEHLCLSVDGKLYAFGPEV
jgi:hypothetical protein